MKRDIAARKTYYRPQCPLPNLNIGATAEHGQSLTRSYGREVSLSAGRSSGSSPTFFNGNWISG